jgi:preflagellin peptidase FlaK
MEEFEEKGEELRRRFIPVRVALHQMVKAKRVYTKDLKRHPDRYKRELALYRRAGMVWISYGVPFILPILAGFATALFGGDILFTAMRVIAGR